MLKLLCAFYTPTTGEILFDEKNIIRNKEFPPSTRCLIEKPNFLSDLTGYENLKLLADIQKVIGDNEINDSLKKDKKYHKYSLGMKQKLGIAQVIMENPNIMILDEPFNGVEEETVHKLRKLLIEEKKKGKIIIIATHIKDDIKELADVVYKFDNGIVTKVDVK